MTPSPLRSEPQSQAVRLAIILSGKTGYPHELLMAIDNFASVLMEKDDVPYRGILFSRAAMLSAVSLGYLLPGQIYIFLVINMT